MKYNLLEVYMSGSFKREHYHTFVIYLKHFEK